MYISVVMASYNGEKTILNQLDTLRLQTLQPDEVLIFDDCSTDRTKELVSNYIIRYSLSGWKLYENEENIGWKRNFFEGIRKSSGDIVFLCDQDDKWYPNKIAAMTKTILAYDEIQLLSCDMRILYQQEAIKAKKYKETKRERSGETTQYGFTKHFFMNPRPGCSYAIRRSFFDEVSGGWKEFYPHDEFLWLMAALQDGAYFQNTVLMDYIRSEQSVSDIRYKDIAMQQKNLAYIMSMLSNMEQYSIDNPEKVPKERLEMIRTAKVWCEKREHLMKTRNPFCWIMLMPYWGYYNSVKNCLSDLYLVLFGSFRRRAI